LGAQSKLVFICGKNFKPLPRVSSCATITRSAHYLGKMIWILTRRDGSNHKFAANSRNFAPILPTKSVLAWLVHGRE